MEPKQVGKTEWGRRSQNLKQEKQGKKIGQFNKFKKYMGRQGRTGKRQQERGRKRDDDYYIKHSKRRQHDDH